MRLKKTFWIPLVSLLIIGVAAWGYLRSEKMAIGGVGTVLDRYKDVAVYDNGPVYIKSYGKHYSADGYYYGQKWQCVEFIKRFYYDALDHRMPNGYGHAKDFFDPHIAQGKWNKERGLVQYRNGGNVAPAPDDLIVFTDTTYGHVAIVTKVTDTTVEVIQQNIYGKPRETFSLQRQDGQYNVGTNRKPAGWLRKID